MVRLIVGKKGSGKTKRLIEEINKAEITEPGHIVCIEKTAKLTYDINHNIKLIDSDDYYISGFEPLYAFIAGIHAANYDTTKIFVDNCLKIGGSDFAEFEKFISKVNALSEKTLVEYTFTVSADKEELPASVSEFII